MEEKKFCYRYVEGNDSQGRPIIMLWENVILRETERTFWHTHDMPYMSIEQMRAYRSKPGDKQVKRCLKHAARSGYHLSKEEAIRAFVYRKTYQLNRLRLTAETVEMCLKGLSLAGYIQDGNVLSAPGDSRFLASKSPGPIASEYSWGEW
ncbi:hypothetical protein NB703_003028 [Pantoea ananatis]|uniref:Uncharacterized protein n=1 Tax=Pantoea ananas TaxID=553 RepID=A0AAJ1D0D7_PANAN|nr:hypothetical protein [Pantoea ananatis]MCW0344935.1 hypothetical protein [Pantoea ananatis]